MQREEVGERMGLSVSTVHWRVRGKEAHVSRLTATILLCIFIPGCSQGDQSGNGPSSPIGGPSNPIEITSDAMEAIVSGVTRPAADVAHDLIWHVDTGSLAAIEAIRIGEPIILAMNEVSGQYKEVHGRNIELAANVICAIWPEEAVASKGAVATFQELCLRERPVERLLGEVGLAAINALPSDTDVEAEWIKSLGLRDPDRWVYIREALRLSILGLGEIRSEAARDCLHDVLAEELGRGSNEVGAELCIALGRVNGEKSVELLRKCLSDSKFNDPPSAFAALISIQDAGAVPLAIERLDTLAAPEDLSKQSIIVELLRMVSGMKHGAESHEWREWWKGAGPEWSIPEEFRLDPWVLIVMAFERVLRQDAKER